MVVCAIQGGNQSLVQKLLLRLWVTVSAPSTSTFWQLSTDPSSSSVNFIKLCPIAHSLGLRLKGHELITVPATLAYGSVTAAGNQRFDFVTKKLSRRRVRDLTNEVFLIIGGWIFSDNVPQDYVTVHYFLQPSHLSTGHSVQSTANDDGIREKAFRLGELNDPLFVVRKCPEYVHA